MYIKIKKRVSQNFVNNFCCFVTQKIGDEIREKTADKKIDKLFIQCVKHFKKYYFIIYLSKFIDQNL